MGGRKGLPIAFVALALTMAVAGCGGSSSDAAGGSTGASTTSGSTPSSTSSSTSSSSSPAGSPASKPAPGFSKKAKLASFGEEATASEREQASEILEKNLKARAAGKYPAQCKTLSQTVIEAIENSRYHVDCKGTLGIEATLMPASKRADTMQGPIAALRIQGSAGYALYHGKDGKDYAMKMELEDGEWKVGEVLTVRLP
jgi:hypothetical protein